MTAEQVRAALRAVTRRMVEGAPYDELTATLDAVAAMPGADELRVEIAGRRLALLEVHHRDATERDRVLGATMPDLAAVPMAERVRWIIGACRYPELAERYLRPLLPELQTATQNDPENIQAQQALWLARRALGDDRPHEGLDARTEGEGPEVEELPPWTPPWPPAVDVGLDVVRWLIVGRRSYVEISEALDAVLALPGGELAAGRVANERALMVTHHNRDDAEAERVLEQIAPVLATFALRDRASAVSLVCVGRPALAEKYMPALIAELEEDLRRSPDAEGEQVLKGIKRGLERTRAAG